jgi:hypothetical protein
MALAIVGCRASNDREARPRPAAIVLAPGSGFRADGAGASARFASYRAELGADRLSLRLAETTLAVTTSVRVGAAALATSAARLREDGALERSGEAVTETVSARPTGVELQWHFARPLGDDAVVRVALAGARFAREDDQGLHFSDARGAPLVRHGHGVFIDAVGTRTPVRARFVEGRGEGGAGFVELRAPTRGARCPCVLDPVIGPEGTLSVGPLDASFGSNTDSAFGAGMHLVAFQDDANLARFVRLLPDGTTADGSGVKLGSDAVRTGVGVTFDGTQFVTVRDRADGIVARVVRTDATMGPDFTLATSGVGPGLTGRPRVAVVAGIAAAFFGYPGGFARFKADGTVLDATPRALTLDDSVSSVASDGAGFLVGGTRSKAGGVEAAVTYVRTDGTTAWTTSLGTVVSADPGPTIAWAAGPAQLLAAWSGGLARLDATGALLGSTASVGHAPFGVASEGTRWLLSSTTASGGAQVAHVDATGAVTGAASVAGLAPSTQIDAVSTGGTNHLLTFKVDRLGTRLGGVWIARSDLAASAPFPLAPVPSRQVGPTAAYAPSGAGFAAWYDDRAAYGTYGVRVDATGTSIDSAARLLAAASFSPVAAFGAGAFQLAWFDGMQAHTAQLQPDGTLGTPFFLPSYAPQGIAYDGTNVLVGFLDVSKPCVVRSTPGVAPSKAPVVVAAGPATSLSLAADATRAIVAFASRVATCTPTPCEDDQDVFVSVLKPDDTVSAPVKVLATTDVDGSPAVALLGGKAFVAWPRHAPGSTAGQVLFARVLESASVAPIKLADGVSIRDVKMIADDRGLFVGFSDAGGLRAVRVSGGAPSVSAPTTISAAPVADFTLAAVSTRKLLALYRVETSQLTRVVTFGGDFGQACGAAGDCESGLCVDGVCCTSSCGGACEACDVVGLEGSCAPVTGKPHGARPACTGVAAGTECGAQCLGVDRTACGIPSTSVACSKTACVSTLAGTETHASTCDGAGACGDKPISCGGHVCTGVVCSTVCAGASDCLAGFFCKGTQCLPLGGLGDPCTATADCLAPAFCTEGVCCAVAACGAAKTCAGAGSRGRCGLFDGQDCAKDDECGSAHCVDGVCCDGACGDECAACDLPGRRGQCTAVLGKPHGVRAPCAVDAANACASRACDGVEAKTCAGFTASGALCKPRSCALGQLTDDARCDGAGACVAGKTTSCGGLTCASDQECRTTCRSQADCMPGFLCDAERCVPEGSTCSSDATTAENGKDGTKTLCSPFACDPTIGKCRSSCLSLTDCLPGFECESDGLCAKSASSAGSGGCTASRTANGSAGAWFGLAAIGIAIAIAGRRRS